ncbi:hypothetical protein INT44_000580 [Umbelopsis vinacea]|uniref:Uncharacterized protein n=1 Tax=Umbelopsis vinacea TaxID=44442 RepID=A0A8H7PMV0_9FUNG|nr:hypothetical protein INT44_000580 [Umbelopsis vinacea]
MEPGISWEQLFDSNGDMLTYLRVQNVFAHLGNLDVMNCCGWRIQPDVTGKLPKIYTARVPGTLPNFPATAIPHVRYVYHY